jgi:glutathione S-transferase
LRTIYSARICPFAQRTRALLTHLGQQYDLREIDLADKPADFLQASPTGRVPLLIEGDLKLYESGIIFEYLAETLDWAGLPDDPAHRARHRLAIKRFDEVVVPVFYGAPVDDTLERELVELEATIAHASMPSTLAFHLAPFWARWDWLRDYSDLAARIDRHPVLRQWLDGAVALPAIQATLPDRDYVRLAYGAYFARLSAV